MRPRDEAELYRRLLELIAEMSREVDAVIVEGEHDRQCLRRLGLSAPIITYSNNRLPDAEFIEMVARRHRIVVVLTDFDSAGVRYHRKLSTGLERAGTRVERIYRQRLKEILQPLGMRTIESLYALRRRLFAE